MKIKTDPFKVPFNQGLSKNGVVIQNWGEGIPFVVIPGLEGSGESCLHILIPAIEKAREEGIPIQLCLVNYSKEKHNNIEALYETMEELLESTYHQKELIIFSQSFGNLMTAKIGSRNKLVFKRIFMISPFTKMPGLKIRTSYYSIFITPTWLYRATIKPLGRYVFGPVGESGKSHPFFDALAKGESSDVRRQTAWMVDLNFELIFSQLKIPVTILLGLQDRLVNIKKEIAFFESLSSKRNDWKLLLNENNGHVIFIPNEVNWVEEEVIKYLIQG